MYLAIDVGGTKTLLAVFSEDGRIVASKKIFTDVDYEKFLDNIKEVVDNDFKDYQITYGCCAIPGGVDRQRGLGVRFGNLSWQNVPLQADLSQLLSNAPVIIEHDAAVGGLSEALEVQSQYRRVLYVAPGTGIGVSFIMDGKIDSDLADNEAGHMAVLQKDGQVKTWEDLASGRALKAKYGKLASEIEDPMIWAEFAHDFARGLQPLFATLQPEVAIMSAGVGAQLHKFVEPLGTELRKLENKMVPIPPIIKAKRPEEAVIYGCYELIKQHQ